MEDMKNSELLQPGQGPAGLPEGAVPRLGPTHAENAGGQAGFGEARDLEMR